MEKYLFQQECYQIIGICMDIHNTLGPGFQEPVYKDAMDIEFCNRIIPYEKEKRFKIRYKGIELRRSFFADYVVFQKILLEIKATVANHDCFEAQTLNYLKASGLKLALIINFGQTSLQIKRLIL